MDWLWTVDDLLHYLGTDFVGLALSFVSLWLLSRKRRGGFLFGALANGAWLCFGFLSHSAATVYANLLFGGMNLNAWARWKHDDEVAGTVTASGR
jgi:hypothetical protein